MNNVQQEIDERTRLVGQNKFEMMLFRLGKAGASEQGVLYGINVFKIRELLDMASVRVMPIAGSSPLIMGVVNVRGQIIQVINLPAAVGCVPENLKILMLTEYASTTQAFAVENVEDIVRLDWSRVKPADGVSGGAGTVTSIAHLEGEVAGSTLAQVLDVEQILRNVNGDGKVKVEPSEVGEGVTLPDGAVILAADDSGVARMMIEEGLKAMGLPYVMTKSGKEAWERLQEMAAAAEMTGKSVRQRVVEDNNDACSILCDVLTVLGHKPHGVGYADAAIQAFAEREYEVLLTDINLPGMSGVELARQLVQGHENLKIIFSSGIGPLGKSDFEYKFASLPKPYDVEKLQKVLADITAADAPAPG